MQERNRGASHKGFRGKFTQLSYMSDLSMIGADSAMVVFSLAK